MTVKNTYPLRLPRQRDTGEWREIHHRNLYIFAVPGLACSYA